MEGTREQDLILLLILSVGGWVVTAASVAADRFLRKSSLSWPTTRGVIIESRVEYDNRCVIYAGDEGCFRPHIAYKYTVDGREYTSNKVSISGFQWCSEFDAHSDQRKYLRYKEVTVYYCPDNPEQSLLQPG